MSLLLDTRALLWWLAEIPLEEEAAARIADPGELVVVSAVSIWEAAIKQSIGKLVAPEALGQAALDEGFEPLPVTFVHAARGWLTQAPP